MDWKEGFSARRAEITRRDWRAVRVEAADRERWPDLGSAAWIVLSPSGGPLRLSAPEFRALLRADVRATLSEVAVSFGGYDVTRGLVTLPRSGWARGRWAGGR